MMPRGVEHLLDHGKKQYAAGDFSDDAARRLSAII
jgi:hypothetical protein